MTETPLIIGSQAVGWLYCAKHQRKMRMNSFAVLVGMIDALVIMAGLSQDPESDVLYNRGAHELTLELLETVDDNLPEIIDQVAGGMLISRIRFDELVAHGEIAPLELLMLLRDELERNYGKPQVAER